MRAVGRHLTLVAFFALSACNGDSYSELLQLSNKPVFAASTEAFRFMSPHPKGAKFELLESAKGDRFVMTHLRNSATLLLLTPVPMNIQYGMMLDENLCSNGLVAYRENSWAEGRYGMNLSAEKFTNVSEPAPVGVCFTKVQ